MPSGSIQVTSGRKPATDLELVFYTSGMIKNVCRPTVRPPIHPKFDGINQSGFSLIEVLISIIILSFGLLGMVGLQAAALQANRDARLQSVATTLARELAEMMRGNKDIAIAAINNPYVGQWQAGNAWQPANPSFCLSVTAAPCTNPAETAQAQMTQWLTRVNTDLPGARVEICSDPAPFDGGGLPRWSTCNSPPGGTVMLKIGWTRGSTDKGAAGDAAFDRAIRPAIVFPVTGGNT